MSYTQKRNTPLVSLVSYIILGIVVFMSIRFSFFQDFLIGFVLTFTLFVIRDMLLFFGIEKGVQHRVLLWGKFREDIRGGVLSMIDIILMVNRWSFFPLFLIGYITLILMKQLDIFSISTILTANPWVEYGLLALVSVSGFLTIWRESLDTNYYQAITQATRTRFFVVMTVILALLAVAIIFQQTSSLGLLSIPISIISGILIFLVGIMLLEEDEGEEKL